MKRWLLLFVLVAAVFTLAIAKFTVAQVGRNSQPATLQAAQSATQVAPLATKVNPNDGLTYVWIPPGTFMMGCSQGDTGCEADENPHEVTIAQGFWIGQTLVTQAAYKRVMGENPSFFHHSNSDLLPAERVEWLGAHAYCGKVGMRLPTEAEYEYAARAGSSAARYGDLDAIAWYKDNGNHHTHEVATKQPNAWHLYDMLGNVWEYTGDPFKPGDPVFVAMRGGCVETKARSMRVSFRGFDAAYVHSKYAGFRCVGD